MTPNSAMKSVVLIIYICEVCGSNTSLETLYILTAVITGSPQTFQSFLYGINAACR
jgi:hypothetical protein